jgi:uncharacterized ion transporter superfamily protein YfcC
MNEEGKDGVISVSAKHFITSIVVVAVLMIAAYAATLLVPCEGIPFWKWILSPVLVLGSDGAGTLIAVIVFLLVIGGIFSALDKCGLMRFILDSLTARFARTKYIMLAAVMAFFMAMGALIGSFEEVVPLVPLAVALAVKLGWDTLTGIAMSLLAVGCGFASGVSNPFTVGVAQGLAGLPMFSGVWLRLLSFALIYMLLFAFVGYHAKAVDRFPVPGLGRPVVPPVPENDLLIGHASDVDDPVRSAKLARGARLFGLILGAGIALCLASGLVPALQDYTMIIVAVMFLAAGVVSTLAAGMGRAELLKWFGKGVVSMLPAVLMILMASSIKYTLETAGVLSVLIDSAISAAAGFPKWAVILFVYAIVLVMNFFIASGSAKAFMLIPLIVPLAGAFGIPAQLCIVAFAFGDGFSNTFYPTNPALLISLSLSGTSYGKWAKYSWKFQALNLALTSAILLFGLAVGYR